MPNCYFLHRDGERFGPFTEGELTSLSVQGALDVLFFPILLAGLFLHWRQAPGAQFCFLWLGEALLDIGLYVADARTIWLPLVGGDIHDWNHLLGRFGLLQQDKRLAALCTFLAVFSFLSAVFLPLLARVKAEQGSAYAEADS